MVPGAGFPDETIVRFANFRQPQFGLRVQHILNDQQRLAAFKAVNQSFAPHVVIFNNDAWPPESFTNFFADRFHILLGAVDVAKFRPVATRMTRVDRWIVGGQAGKNPAPLIESLSLLGPEVSVRLFGPDRFGLAQQHPDLIESGRLELVGRLLGDDLCRFFHRVDCVVTTETMAG
jgi:hypothetical protein